MLGSNLTGNPFLKYWITNPELVADATETFREVSANYITYEWQMLPALLCNTALPPFYSKAHVAFSTTAPSHTPSTILRHPLIRVFKL
jgi:hypothetical protein